MRRISAFLLGLAAGLALVGLLRRRRRAGTVEATTGDARAEELRRKLAESRQAAGGGGAAPAGTDAGADPEPAGGEEIERARQAVHREAQGSLDEMRRAGL